MSAVLGRAERDRAAASLKRHNALVKSADKVLKKRGGSKVSALQLLLAAFEEAHLITTLLRIAELQYQLNRFVDAAASAEKAIRSQPSAEHRAAAEAIMTRCGTQSRLDAKSDLSSIHIHLDAVLGGIAAAPQLSVSAPPPPVVGRPSEEAMHKADTLFFGAARSAPPQLRAPRTAANPFGHEPSTALVCPGAAAPKAAGANPFEAAAEEEEASTALVCSGVHAEVQTSPTGPTEAVGGEPCTALAVVDGLDEGQLLAAALQSLQAIASRVEELFTHPEGAGELRSLVRDLAQLHE